jgi:hypothetical protein
MASPGRRFRCFPPPVLTGSGAKGASQPGRPLNQARGRPQPPGRGRDGIPRNIAEPPGQCNRKNRQGMAGNQPTAPRPPPLRPSAYDDPPNEAPGPDAKRRTNSLARGLDSR